MRGKEGSHLPSSRALGMDHWARFKGTRAGGEGRGPRDRAGPPRVISLVFADETWSPGGCEVVPGDVDQ